MMGSYSAFFRVTGFIFFEVLMNLLKSTPNQGLRSESIFYAAARVDAFLTQIAGPLVQNFLANDRKVKESPNVFKRRSGFNISNLFLLRLRGSEEA